MLYTVLFTPGRIIEKRLRLDGLCKTDINEGGTEGDCCQLASSLSYTSPHEARGEGGWGDILSEGHFILNEL